MMKIRGCFRIVRSFYNLSRMAFCAENTGVHAVIAGKVLFHMPVFFTLSGAGIASNNISIWESNAMCSCKSLISMSISEIGDRNDIRGFRLAPHLLNNGCGNKTEWRGGK